MNKLKILLQPMPNPFPDEIPSLMEIWCEISIVVFFENGGSKVLYFFMWEIKEFIEWFLVSYPVFSTVSKEEIKVHKLERESFAEILDRCLKEIRILYDFDEIEDREFTTDENEKVDLWSEAEITLYDNMQIEYRSIKEGFSGYRMPMIIVGLSKGQGEISLVEQDTNWKYNFVMDEFISDTLLNIKNALIEYKEKYFYHGISTIYNQLLTELQKHIEVDNHLPN